MDRLCTEVVGLDGQGESALYGSVDQWLTVLEKMQMEDKKAAARPASAPAARPASTRARKLNFREQQEWDGMEAAITAGEEAVVACHTKVERSATAGHTALAEACRALEEAQRKVELLYARWQELEAMRGNAKGSP